MINRPHDFAGQTKPPCFFCGGESSAWLEIDGEARRVCTECSLRVVPRMVRGGRVLVMLVPKGR